MAIYDIKVRIEVNKRNDEIIELLDNLFNNLDAYQIEKIKEVLEVKNGTGQYTKTVWTMKEEDKLKGLY